MYQALKIFSPVAKHPPPPERAPSPLPERTPPVSPKRRVQYGLFKTVQEFDNTAPADAVKDQRALPSGVSKCLSVKQLTREELRELETAVAKRNSKNKAQKEITLKCTRKRIAFFNRLSISEDHPMSGLVKRKLVYKVDRLDKDDPGLCMVSEDDDPVILRLMADHLKPMSNLTFQEKKTEANDFLKNNFRLNWSMFYERNKTEYDAATGRSQSERRPVSKQCSPSPERTPSPKRADAVKDQPAIPLPLSESTANNWTSFYERNKEEYDAALGLSHSVSQTKSEQCAMSVESLSLVSERLAVKEFTREELRELETAVAKRKSTNEKQKEITLPHTRKRIAFFDRLSISEDHPMSGLVESKLVYKVNSSDGDDPGICMVSTDDYPVILRLMADHLKPMSNLTFQEKKTEACEFLKNNFRLNWSMFYERNKTEYDAATGRPQSERRPVSKQCTPSPERTPSPKRADAVKDQPAIPLPLSESTANNWTSFYERNKEEYDAALGLSQSDSRTESKQCAMEVESLSLVSGRPGAKRSPSPEPTPSPSPKPTPSQKRIVQIGVIKNVQEFDNTAPADAVKDQRALPSVVPERLAVKVFTREELRELETAVAKRKSTNERQKEIKLKCTGNKCAFFDRLSISEDHPMSGLVKSKLVYKVDPLNKNDPGVCMVSTDDYPVILEAITDHLKPISNLTFGAKEIEAREFLKKNFRLKWSSFKKLYPVEINWRIRHA